MARRGLTPDVAAIRREIRRFLDGRDDEGRQPCSAKCAVYAFFDYDDEPIYVGQTYENVRIRLGRHLTGQRSDAVAKHVLDPLEVARIEVWPFWGLETRPVKVRKETLNKAEYTVFQMLTRRARVSKLLNEEVPASTEQIPLPQSYTGTIVPDALRERLGHPDERISRRAATTANLAQVIRERDVSLGLRRTMVTQAERLVLLARERFAEVSGDMSPEERKDELVGDDSESE
jgi:hypothetical protein